MLRHEARDEVIHFALPACDRHAGIVGEGKANVKRNQTPAATTRMERTLRPLLLILIFLPAALHFISLRGLRLRLVLWLRALLGWGPAFRPFGTRSVCGRLPRTCRFANPA